MDVLNRMNDEKSKNEFQKLCAQYLSTCSVNDLRCYGRTLNLPYPTRLKKKILIDEIIRALCGEVLPQRSKRGAPIKNQFFPIEIVDNIEKLQHNILGTPVHNEPDTTFEKQDDTPLHLSITVNQLTETQKKLLKKFIDSL